jgi:hypothetical protein
MFSVYFDAFCKVNLLYRSHHCYVFTLLYCGEMKNVNRELKLHTYIAHEVCYLRKKAKSVLVEWFSSVNDFSAEKSFGKNII